ncbi:MAG TPA: hypothetical protein VLJ80_08290 [Solirubrobacteraceae bacterium]|nr:hypothetical protein [Solirubrobacteraceae bacterium]
MSLFELLVVIAIAVVSVAAIVVVRRMLKRLVARIQIVRKRVLAALKAVGAAVAGGGTSLLVERRSVSKSRTDRILDAPDDFRTVLATGGASLLIERRSEERVAVGKGQTQPSPG